MSEKTEVNNYSMGLSSILTIIFVIAKITGYIHWSWWLVFLPSIVCLSLGLFIVLVVFVVAGVAIYFGGR